MTFLIEVVLPTEAYTYRIDQSHPGVIFLFEDVVKGLEDLLEDLKSIVKDEIILGCTLEELAKLVGALLIVCIFPKVSLLTSLKWNAFPLQLVIKIVWLVVHTFAFQDVALSKVIAHIG